MGMVKPFPNKPWFLRVCSTSLLKTLWEKEKLLVTSNFSFSHSVFYSFGELYVIFIKLKIVVCTCFEFGKVQGSEKEIEWTLKAWSEKEYLGVINVTVYSYNVLMTVEYRNHCERLTRPRISDGRKIPGSNHLILFVVDNKRFGGRHVSAPSYTVRHFFFYLLTLSQTSPGFHVSEVHFFWKHCGKRRNCS